MIELLILDTVVFFCIYLIFTLSLNFQQGYCGICNLGLYLPIIIGALITAYLPGRLAMKIYALDPGLDFVHQNAEILRLLKMQLQNNPLISILILVITIVGAMGISALVGYLCTYPALKLPETYLAVFLLSLAESVRVIGMQTREIAGGVMGINTIDPFWWFGTYTYFGSTAFIIGVTIIVFIIFHLMCNSPLGRLLKAIRENELTAQCVGKNISAIKKKVMSFSFSILGLGGCLHAFHMGATVAGGYTRVDFSFWPWLMMIVGGTGNNTGVFLGTFFLVIMRRCMIILKHYFTFLPFDVIWLEPILLAVMLVLIMIFRPAGVLPEKTSRIKNAQP
jgi:branched-chain amino acid transport system permease protein